MNKKRLDLQLRSNVKLGYDYCFSRHAEYVFLRMYHTPTLDNQNMLRRDMFKKLETLGIETVPNGPVKDLLKLRDPAWGLVVYTDERAHMGNGKLWLSSQEALRDYPHHWASEFIPPAGKAIRHFQFGVRAFTMPFQTFDDWRCQKGKSTYSYCVPGSRYEHLFPDILPYPYFAIDFIPGTDMATDIQMVPGMTDDRLENWMNPREMYQALQEAAWILKNKGLIKGSQAGGYGLIKASDLVNEQAWLDSIGLHE